MRLIAWNCNMAFRKKLAVVLSESPDILVISESESPEKFILTEDIPVPNDSVWFGDNPHKGIGVYTYNGFTIQKIKAYNPEFRYVIPLLISNHEIEFVLLAIWCQKPVTNDNYGTHTWQAINYYTTLLKNEKVIIAGDLNSNTIWDKPNREANHSNIVNRLEKKGIKSTYHVFKQEKQGEEKCPTLFLHRNVLKPYHIDFCFGSEYFIQRLQNVTVGKHEDWTKHSDHTPVIVDFEID